MPLSTRKRSLNLLFYTFYFFALSRFIFSVYSSYTLPFEYTQSVEYIIKHQFYTEQAMFAFFMVMIHASINYVLDDLDKIKRKLDIKD
ncbi:hypothetical protein [Shewanella maritima]|uniref:hypothetical protein n=1 Tax=Shewanella maritima TaxID=2520507 RepID=UPI0037358AE4